MIENLRRNTGCDIMKISAFLSLVTLFAVVFIGADSLHGVQLVFPPVVRLGGEATLLCLYDLEGEPLYSVKWYRGNQEFYRYMPKESPSGRAFPFEGIVVDTSSSNAHQVSLKNVPLHLSGKFRCEVSTDAPLFTTRCSEDQLTVLHATRCGYSMGRRRRVKDSTHEIRLLTKRRTAPEVCGLSHGAVQH